MFPTPKTLERLAQWNTMHWEDVRGSPAERVFVRFTEKSDTSIWITFHALADPEFTVRAGAPSRDYPVKIPPSSEGKGQGHFMRLADKLAAAYGGWFVPPVQDHCNWCGESHSGPCRHTYTPVAAGGGNIPPGDSNER